MTDDQLQKHNEKRLNELHPAFALKIRAILLDLESHGWRARIVQAYRPQSHQAALIAAGNSSVTRSWHNFWNPATDKPAALAADIVDDKWLFAAPMRYWLHLASSARSHGLETGILWQLLDGERKALDQAISEKFWAFPGLRGSDPAHVQPIQPPGKTVLQAYKLLPKEYGGLIVK